MKPPKQYSEEEALAKLTEVSKDAMNGLRELLERFYAVNYNESFDAVLFDPRLMQYAVAVYSLMMESRSVSQEDSEKMETWLKLTTWLYLFKQDILKQLKVEE